MASPTPSGGAPICASSWLRAYPNNHPVRRGPMFDINLKHSLATVAVAAGLLAATGPASAGTHDAGVIAYNGHAGLGASVYQHNQTDLEFLAVPPHAAGITDGTSNTISFGERAARPSGFSIDIGTSENIAADGRGAD
jgi:hypothetical protein